ncbi:glycine rich domain-containing protein [Bacillus cereus]|uniref:glycine rich domain-containing protein n=1 Tax=Bacillus sp. G3(2015) TaxID=1706731 RepID=UPI0007389D5B|nr:glycine rich domain-containing protein [Bacillus sp. G3(2015)]KUF34455.1 hypothetical protein AMR94_02350 [Bacillus sp. G3(2015)]MEB9378713.1 glycine rich domain-containing protein [Bacillus cereus]
MATYTINQPGSATSAFPTNLKRGDKMIFNNTSTGKNGTILQWKVPYDGIYVMEAWGAQGGELQYGGKGARMKGEFTLKKDQVFRLLIGQMGSYELDTYNYYQGGGGGGTFISLGTTTPFLIAGGGGGVTQYSANNPKPGYQGEITKLASVVPSGPSSRGEGQGGNAGGGTGAGGAGGYYSDGTSSTAYGGKNGYSFVSGGQGGISWTEGKGITVGGFGGGGGGGFSAGGGGGGYTGGTGGGNAAAFPAGGGGSYNAGSKQDNAPGVNSGHGRIEITFVGSANEPPTEPSLTKQPISKSMNLSNEIVPLEWTASTDPEGNSIAYEIDFYNGSTWASIAKNIIDTNYDCIIPSVATDKAQLRVRATDSENGASEYSLSNVFTVAKQLYVIKDGEIRKTYKDGNWESI